MNDVTVERDPRQRSGFARIRVGGAAAFLANPRYRLQGPDEQAPFLGPHDWQGAEILLQPLSAAADGLDLLLEIGPAVVDIVEAGTIGFSLPAAGINCTVIWPVLQPSRGGTQSVFLNTPVSPQAAAQVPTGVWEKSVPQPRSDLLLPPSTPVAGPPEPGASQKRGRMPVYIGSILVVAVVAFGLWEVFGTSHPRTSSPPPQPAPAAAPQPQPAVQATNTACDTEAFPAITKCETDPAALFAIAQTRLKSGNSGDAISLFQFLAGPPNNYGPGALALATLYDPATSNSPIQPADSDQAAQYYKLAVTHHDADADAPRQKLFNDLTALKQRGDEFAPDILNKYWP